MNTQHEVEERDRQHAGDHGPERLLAGIQATERQLAALEATRAGARGVTVDSAPGLVEFERNRLALFARHGFEGESRWVTDAEGRTTYAIGRGGGPCPTVLVHGGLSQAGEWFSLAGLIPGHVIVPDRPGCGLSYPIDYRKVADFRQAAVAWLLDFLDGIDADQVDLVGNSMGSFFAMAFAIAHPHRVRRLVLVGAPVGLGEMRAPLFMRLWGLPITGPLISKLKITDPEKLRKQVYPLLVAHPETVPLDFLELDIAQATLPGVGRTSYTLLRALSTWRGMRPELILRDEMGQLPTPTLFVWGDADAFVPSSVGREVAATMPDARIEVLPDTGHLPHVEQPETVAGAINGFLVHWRTA
jgi:pimeloyl-ACP methyl ester carboxylesterase